MKKENNAYTKDDKDSSLKTDLITNKSINGWYLLGLVCYEINSALNSAASKAKVDITHIASFVDNFRSKLTIAGVAKKVLATDFSCCKLIKKWCENKKTQNIIYDWLI